MLPAWGKREVALEKHENLRLFFQTLLQGSRLTRFSSRSISLFSSCIENNLFLVAHMGEKIWFLFAKCYFRTNSILKTGCALPQGFRAPTWTNFTLRKYRQKTENVPQTSRKGLFPLANSTAQPLLLPASSQTLLTNESETEKATAAVLYTANITRQRRW